MKAAKKRNAPVDDYEDLLNTIEQEHSRDNASAAVVNFKSAVSDRSGSVMPSSMTMDQARDS